LMIRLATAGRASDRPQERFSWYYGHLLMACWLEGPMAAFLSDLVVICVVGFLIVAGLSAATVRTPATPPFPRRARTSGSSQLWQYAIAQFFRDRGFLFRRRFLWSDLAKRRQHT